MSPLVAASERLDRAEAELRAASKALEELREAQTAAALRTIPIVRMSSELTELAECLQVIVARHHGISVLVLLSRAKFAPIVDARQQAMVLLRKLLHLSLHDTGKLFDRDHGTVMHAERAVAARCQTSATYRIRFEQLRSYCEQQTQSKGAA